MLRMQHLKGAAFKGKNMLPNGSIFFPSRVATMRIESNLNEKPQKVNSQWEHILSFKSSHNDCLFV